MEQKESFFEVTQNLFVLKDLTNMKHPSKKNFFGKIEKAIQVWLLITSEKLYFNDYHSLTSLAQISIDDSSFTEDELSAGRSKGFFRKKNQHTFKVNFALFNWNE